MPKIKHLINDLINQDKVLPDGFFTQNSKVISEHLHASVKGIEDKRGAHVVKSRDYEEHAAFLCKEVVDPIDVLLMKRYLTKQGGASPFHILNFQKKSLLRSSSSRTRMRWAYSLWR